MINKVKRWIANAVQDGMAPQVAVPDVVRHGCPSMTIYKINNGYLVHKQDGRHHDINACVVFCKTPIEVGQQIINNETLNKMGIQKDLFSTVETKI